MSKYIEVRDKLIKLKDEGKTNTKVYKKLEEKWKGLQKRGIW